MADFTKKQGQYLAFIHLYRKLHRQGPAEPDIAKYFRVSPPSVHQMIVKLDELGLITREPGVARSMRVAIPASEILVPEDFRGMGVERRDETVRPKVQRIIGLIDIRDVLVGPP